MGPDHLKFGGGVSATVLHPAVLLAVLIAGGFILFRPGKQALAAFLAAAVLIPMDQVLLIGPAHFPMLRVLVLFGFLRILKDRMFSQRRIFSNGVNKIDIASILLAIFIALDGMLLFQAPGEVINELGILYTTCGIYFLLRHLIRSEEDVMHAIRTLACIAAIVALVMSYEQATGHNPYAVLGGARVSKYASLAIREDHYRAQGPFSHPILAGTFGAVLVPLFVGLWQKGRHRALSAAGIISATIITVACNSSTPVLAYAAGLLALGSWPLRRWLRVMRWGLVAAVVGLHLVMKAPVWHLISRIDVTGGSSSWHRYMLVDECIRHFGDWWLIGVKDTSVWGWDMWDTANQYVSLCDNSGLLPFLLFLAVLVFGFKYLGGARRGAQEKSHALLVWALGSSLFANTIGFFGISYYDQTQVAWYALLAMIPAAIAVRDKKTLTAPRSVPAGKIEVAMPVADLPVCENSI
jgi:hypothetical protein